LIYFAFRILQLFHTKKQKNLISVVIATAAAFLPPDALELLAQQSEDNVPKAGKACDTTVILNSLSKYSMITSSAI
jgi:hypothetical protein